MGLDAGDDALGHALEERVGQGGDAVADHGRLLGGRRRGGHERRDVGLAAILSRAAEGWRLTVTTRRLAQSVRVRCDGVLPSDNYFHLAPGEGRTLSLAGAGDDAPSGTVEALDGLAAVAFAMQPPDPAGEKPAGA